MKKLLCVFLVVLTMGTMYYFSSQDGNTSSHQSNAVVTLIDKVRDVVTLEDENLIHIKEKVFNTLKKFGDKEYVVRKMAHFGIYACIGVSIFLLLYTFTKKLYLSSTFALLLSMFYAYYDETRQLGVDGRYGSLKDVFIDSSGAFVGISIFFILILFIKTMTMCYKFFFRREN